MPQSKSSRRWLKEHFSDPYVKKAQEKGYRSRAVYKLQELQERYHLFKQGMTVIDLGSAPGGWAQYVSTIVSRQGQVIAMDILPMEAIPGVSFIQGDFTDELIFQQLLTTVGEKKIDCVLSDMAPNLSGIESVDQPKSIYLAELALNFAISVLDKNGFFLVKVFQGVGYDDFLAKIRQQFKKVMIRKPKASRGRSREVYVLAVLRYD